MEYQLTSACLDNMDNMGIFVTKSILFNPKKIHLLHTHLESIFYENFTIFFNACQVLQP